MGEEPTGKGEELSHKALMLRVVPGFAALEDRVLEELAGLCTVRPIARNTRLITQGNRAESLYLVLSGRFRVSTEGKTIAYIGTGEPIGELAFFAGGPRTADVTALRNSVVLECTRTQYEKMAALHPGISSRILSSVAARLAAVTQKAAPLPPQAGRIAVVVGANDAPLSDAFISGLRNALAEHSDVVIHSADDVPGSGKQTAFGDWLRQFEEQGKRQVLLIADTQAHPGWAEMAPHFADSLFVIAPPGAALPPNPDSVEMRHSDTETDALPQLVICRDTADAPIIGSADWLSGRTVSLHHHLALDRARDFARLARFICDKACGLVLAGGGAFGTAHLGAVKALREAGIEIDAYGGTSVGAAMAAALAMDLDPDEIMRRTMRMFVAQKAMRKLTAPLYSVLDHRVFDSVLKENYGAALIEDLPVNFFAAAASLSRNELDILRRGPVWQAVRASSSIPALLPPVISPDGEVQVDGGLIDNLPLREMRQFKAGPNIAFDFDLASDWRVEASYDALPRPMGALAGLMLGQTARPSAVRRFPRIASVLARSMAMNSRRRLAGLDRGSDVVIALPIKPRASFLDWREGQAHFDLAYRHMAQALAKTDADGADFMTRLHAAGAQLGARRPKP